MTRKRGQHHGDLRRSLLDAALRLLARGEEPGLRAVARVAGVSPGAPYHHFANKTTLLAAVAAEGFVGLGEALRRFEHLPPPERLESMAAAYVGFAVEHGAHYRVMFDPSLRGPDGFPDPALEAAARGTFAQLVAVVTAVGGRQSAARRALRAWGLAHGLVVLHLDGLVAQLDPDLHQAALASDVGRACLLLARGGA